MTIENATPTARLDQADVLSIIGGLVDHLVNAVADRVLAQLNESLSTRIDNAMDSWAMNSMVLEDKMGEAVQSFVDTQLDLDDAVRQALDNVALDDMIVDAVRELNFEVSVSR